MKNLRTLLAACGLIAASGLTGCWGNDDDGPRPPTPITEVPDSAGVSTTSFVSFLLGLSTGDESSEPLTIQDTFAVPADETGEPTPLA
jgi:hypothetical protein